MNWLQRLNPFREKVVYANLTAKGYERKFKAITADGKVHYTTRKDRIYIYAGWRPKSFHATIHTITAEKVMKIGIEEGIWINDKTLIAPVLITEYKKTPITLVETWSETYHIDAPTLSIDEGITKLEK